MKDQFIILFQKPLTVIPVIFAIGVIAYMIYLVGEQAWIYLKSKFNSKK
jgi:hypothetical protein